MLCVALAIALLRQWDRVIFPTFYDHVAFWDVRGWPTRQELKDTAGVEILQTIDEQFRFAYQPGKTTYDHPLDHSDRLASLPGRHRHRGPSYSDIYSSFATGLPKRFKKPNEA